MTKSNHIRTIILGALLALGLIASGKADATPATALGIYYGAVDLSGKIAMEFHYGTQGYWSRYHLVQANTAMGNVVIPQLSAAYWAEVAKK